MRLAVIADVHANLPALLAVLKDMAARNVEGVVHLGDLVGYGPHPNEVVAKIKELEVPGVVGNYDLAVTHPDEAAGMAEFLKAPNNELGEIVYRWTRAHINEETRAFLKELPATMTIEENGRSMTFFHGSPERANEYLLENTEEVRFAELFELTGADVMVGGHTHQPTAREVGGGLFLNPGSVGRPKDGDPRASYMILDTEGGFRAEHVRVTFNVESVAADCVSSGLPEEQAEGLKLGRALF